MDYAADHDVALVANLNRLKKVPFKKPAISATVDYMSMAAITAIIKQPDVNTPKGLRDRLFIMLLYDTGARIQEMLNLKLSDLQLGRLPRACLINGGMPNGERFFRWARQKFAGILTDFKNF